MILYIIYVFYFYLYRGTSQGSLIFPWIFNLCLGPLLIWLERKLGKENIIAYTDDIVFLTSASLLNIIFTEMVDRANEIGLTINVKKTKTMQILQQRGKPQKYRTSLKPYESLEELKYLGTIINK